MKSFYFGGQTLIKPRHPHSLISESGFFFVRCILICLLLAFQSYVSLHLFPNAVSQPYWDPKCSSPAPWLSPPDTSFYFSFPLSGRPSVLTPLMMRDVHMLNIVDLNVLYTYVFPHRTVISLKHSHHLKLCLALSRHSNMSEWVMEGWRGNES